MLIVGNIETLARDVSSAIQEYLVKEDKTQTTPDEVMDYLIEKGLFEREKKKKLKLVPLENVLTQLNRIGRENLIAGLRSEKTKKQTLWYFDRIDN
jgi:hypothetical protein